LNFILIDLLWCWRGAGAANHVIVELNLVQVVNLVVELVAWGLLMVDIGGLWGQMSRLVGVLGHLSKWLGLELLGVGLASLKARGSNVQ